MRCSIKLIKRSFVLIIMIHLIDVEIYNNLNTRIIIKLSFKDVNYARNQTIVQKVTSANTLTTRLNRSIIQIVTKPNIVNTLKIVNMEFIVRLLTMIKNWFFQLNWREYDLIRIFGCISIKQCGVPIQKSKFLLKFLVTNVQIVSMLTMLKTLGEIVSN